MSQPPRIAVLPARGGSKRVPRKNVRPFCGRPMIAYAIAAARESGLFDRVVVSTDDAEIMEVARDHGAEVPFERPADLADDHTPTVPVVAHAIEALELPPDAEVCCIYATVPFLRAEDLVRSHAVLREGHYAFPVVEFPSAIERALRRGSDGATAPGDSRHATTRTQDLEPAYYDAGQFYWGHAATWSAGKVVHQHAYTVDVPRERAVDIDTPEDWAFAERLMRALSS